MSYLVFFCIVLAIALKRIINRTMVNLKRGPKKPIDTPNVIWFAAFFSDLFNLSSSARSSCASYTCIFLFVKTDRQKNVGTKITAEFRFGPDYVNGVANFNTYVIMYVFTLKTITVSLTCFGCVITLDEVSHNIVLWKSTTMTIDVIIKYFINAEKRYFSEKNLLFP